MAKVSLRAYNREIEAMIDRGHLDEAVAHCQHILKTFPKHIETYRLLGKSYLEAKRYNEAVDIFSRVLAAEPNDFVSQVGMSIIRDEQNKLDDAIWHMERAFEVQSANPAIQSELQRLYGRRDGAQPPRIRMTRGALAHMYMRGELYPQAISESKNVLLEDQGRSDMQVLLARAYYKSGQKNDASDAASAVLKRYPYCLDANRVLTEVLSSDRPENAQVYRQRVIELDPYAAQVNGTVFQANEVSDAAVSLEHLEWNGQTVGMPSDWGTTGAISLESGSYDRNAQPDWLKNALPETTSTPPSTPMFAPAQDSFSSSPASSPAQPAEDIPDFLRAAGWGESTGSFDESKASAMFDDTPAISPEPIVQGDLPDWVKAMAPQQQTQPAGQEEEIPDWINKIGTGALPVPSASSTSGDGDDWMNLLGEAPVAQQKDSNPELDWLKGLGDEQPASASDNQQDWMKGFGDEQEPAPAIQSNDQPDWLKSFGTEQGSSDFDFLNELKSDPEEPMTSQPKPETSKPASQPSANADDLGKSGQEIDDALAWFEGLAAKQGATEGLLTKPEERMDQEPDWVKKVKGAGNAAQPAPAQQPIQQPASETPKPVPPVAPAPQPVANVEDLGKSGQEIDDALAWFESLAAKQGATEGLLTKPEERLEQEPEWVKQAKSAPQQPPVQQPVAEAPTSAPASQPSANVEDLGKSGQEIDDALAWFESLAAKQGATEGLLTKPEERLEQEPEWVKQAKNAPQQPPVQQPVAETPQPVANVEDLGKSGQEIDDALAWFEGLAAKQGATEGLLTKPEERMEQEPDWVQQVKSAPQQPVAQPAEEMSSTDDDVTSWLKGLDAEEETQQPAPVAEDDTASWLKSLDEPEESPVPSMTASDDLPAWMKGVSEEEPPVAEPVAPMDEAKPIHEPQDVTSWLSSLAEEEVQAPSIPVSDDLPAWMRDETGEVVAEPTKIEPTRPADWKPVDEHEEAVLPPPPAPKVVSQPKPEPTPAPVQEKPAPEPKKRSVPSRKTEIKPATPPEPYKEPVTRRMTGMLTMPVDPILGSARNELSRSNIPGALETYEKLIKKGRFLEEVIYDLREALYRYPVEVSIWQTLGDAYMRANQLQDALDAYTKAEELLR